SDSFRVTKRAEEAVIEDLEMAGSIKDTSRRTGLSWDVCKNIHKRYLQSTISFSLGGSEYLAIDEFSIKKGHKYGTVVADIVTKRVLWVGEGKSNTEVSRFFVSRNYLHLFQ
ncbi:transposase, partial [Succinivibrio sp.]|uniref:transposase n=1 Tax=Succinivibrio sp. TaxID=2053619 RepID=UPI0025F0521E